MIPIHPDIYVPKKSPSLNGLGCITPFVRFELALNGDINLCCASWLPIKCGNILTDEYSTLLNNVNRNKILNDMKAGNFSYCTNLCNLIAYSQKTDGNTMKKSFSELYPLEQIETVVSDTAFMINLNYDYSCNLECPSCRNYKRMYKLNSDPEIVNMHNRVKGFIQFLLDNGKKVDVSITGTGDPFASPTYFNYMKELAENPNPNLNLRLITNGVLMTPKNLNLIKPLWPQIKSISISIDAASEATYKIVRKNGNFQKLKNNLNYLDNLILSNQIKTNWSTYYVVQFDNYKEVKLFADWLINSYKSCDRIAYTIIAQWGHVNDEDFVRMSYIDNVFMTELLKDEIFNNKIINIGPLNKYLT